MGFFGNLNGTGNIDWNLDTKDFPYVKLADKEIQVEYPVKGVFITPDNGYGNGACAIIDGEILNLPQHQVENVRAIISNEEAVQSIKDGKVSIVITTYESKKFKKTCFDIDWIEK